MNPAYEDDLVRLYHASAVDHLDDLELGDVALVTDPPYGISHASGQSGRLKGRGIEGDGDTSLREWAVGWAVDHGDAPAIVFGSWKKPPPPGTRGTVIWDKGMGVGMGDLKLPWKPNWEEIYLLGQGFEGRRDDGVLKGQEPPSLEALAQRLRDGEASPEDLQWAAALLDPGSGEDGVLKGHTMVSWVTKGREHPNQKPVDLMERLIRRVEPDRVIVDPFTGSGATLRAAKNMGRHAVGFEIDAEWIPVAKRLLAQETLLSAVEPDHTLQGSLAFE